jgi:predicted protein tyrosine phosphatase
MKVLFICNQNLHRSKTAEELFKDRFETRSAGIYRNMVQADALQWADLVVVMDDNQRRFISENFPSLYLQKRIITLGIPDLYSKGQPELIAQLQSKMEELL